MTGTETLTITHIEFTTTKPEVSDSVATQDARQDSAPETVTAPADQTSQEAPVLQ